MELSDSLFEFLGETKLLKLPEKDGGVKFFPFPFCTGDEGPSSALIYLTVRTNDLPSSTKEKFPEVCSRSLPSFVILI